MHAARCCVQAGQQTEAADHPKLCCVRIVQAVLFFWASWSAPCKHMQQVLEMLAKQHPSIAYLQVCHCTESDTQTAPTRWAQAPAAAAALGLN